MAAISRRLTKTAHKVEPVRGLAKPDKSHVLMHRAENGRFISFFGDLHPSFFGNVVKAMGGAKRGYPVVSRALAAQPATDANDFWIRLLRAQHPVQSYGQLTRCRHFGHRFRLLMAAMQILFAKAGIKPHRNLRRFHQQHSQHAVALLADRAQLLTSARGMLARNQSQITGHLLATLEAAHLAHGQHVG